MSATSDVTTKTCTKCKSDFPATTEYFPRQTRASSGLHSWCKTCNHRRDKEWKQNNPDKVLNNKKLYRERHPERVAEQKRNAEAKKPEHYATKRREWVVDHPENIRLAKQKTYSTHRADWRRYSHEYRARKRGALGKYFSEDIEVMFRMQRGLCWWCSEELPKGYHIDHRIPLSRGGSNAPDNLCLSCGHCNDSKGAKLPQEWNGRLL